MAEIPSLVQGSETVKGNADSGVVLSLTEWRCTSNFNVIFEDLVQNTQFIHVIELFHEERLKRHESFQVTN